VTRAHAPGLPGDGFGAVLELIGFSAVFIIHCVWWRGWPARFRRVEIMSQKSVPLKNLRGVLLLLILAFHAFSAYIVTQPSSPPPFDQPPYDWQAFPIIDSDRWLGFDLFCAFQFLYLMQFMFFLSGLFVWPSLQRKGWKEFLRQRVFRLGVPFVVGVYLLVPLAFYPVYRVTAVDPSWSAFWTHWTALPLTPTGPMWFLWCLVVFDMCAALLYWLMPRLDYLFAKLPTWIVARPVPLFVAVIAVTAIAYLPLSAIYSPWYWAGIGPFEVQAAFAPQYAIYFFLGLAIGAYGFERSLFAANGPLVRRWPLWSGLAFAAFLLWIVPTALMQKMPDMPVAALRAIGDLGLVMFAGAICFAMTAMFQRIARTRWPIVDEVSEHGYGVYFFHYPIVLWLQYALLDRTMPAVAKGLIVFAVTVFASWAASVLWDRALALGYSWLARIAPFFGAHPDTGSRLPVIRLFD
jgi:glucan biosynthesis protein C